MTRTSEKTVKALFHRTLELSSEEVVGFSEGDFGGWVRGCLLIGGDGSFGASTHATSDIGAQTILCATRWVPCEKID